LVFGSVPRWLRENFITEETFTMQKLDRRRVIQGAAFGAAALIRTPSILAQSEPNHTRDVAGPHPFVLARDGTRLFVQDWGSGRPIMFLSAWTFQSNVWGSHMAALSPRGFRCVVPDRRGYGRSDAPSTGYDLDTMVDDLSMNVASHNTFHRRGATSESRSPKTLSD
jgi:hypothetical protein